MKTAIKIDRSVRFTHHGVHDQPVFAVMDTYKPGGGKAIELFTDDEEMEPWTMATSNLAGISLADDEVLIKTYSENEGLLEDMEEAGIVRRTGRYIPSGFVNIPVCKLLRKIPGFPKEDDK